MKANSKLVSKEQDEPPNYFYKYRSISGENRERTLLCLVRSWLWFSSPLDFKDKNDCRLPVSYEATPQEFRATAEKVLSAQMPQLSPNARCALIESAIENRAYADPGRIDRQRYWYENHVMQRGVLSLCSTNVSDRMWREYADNNHGCCFEFKRSTRGMFANVEKARYEEKLTTINSYEMPYVEMNNAKMLTKICDYDFEQEWRIWDPRCRVNLKYNKGDLTGVIFGRLMPTEDRNLLFYLTRRSHPSAILYEAVKVKGRIKIIPLN